MYLIQQEMFIFSSLTAHNILVTSSWLDFIRYLCRSRFCHLHMGKVFVPLCGHQPQDTFTLRITGTCDHIC